MECVNPIYVRKSAILVRCGKCASCRDAYQKAWIVRLQFELENSISAYFLTLTFSPENYLDSSLEFGKREITLFLKRLRQYLSKGYPPIKGIRDVMRIESGEAKLKYFLVGEYGSKFSRLHFHLLLFNCPFDKEGTQAIVESIWSNGLVHIGTVQPQSIHYVTDYILKGDKNVYRTMSKGLGEGYITQERIDFHNTSDTNYVRTRYGMFAMPRYYSNRIFSGEKKKELFDKYIKTVEHSATDRMYRYQYIQNKLNHNQKNK